MCFMKCFKVTQGTGYIWLSLNIQVKRGERFRAKSRYCRACDFTWTHCGSQISHLNLEPGYGAELPYYLDLWHMGTSQLVPVKWINGETGIYDKMFKLKSFEMLYATFLMQQSSFGVCWWGGASKGQVALLDHYRCSNQCVYISN